MGFCLRATGRDRLGVDADEVRRALAVLADPAAGVELRGIPSGRSRVFAAGELDRLVSTAADLSDDDGIYYTLNPIPADLNHAARVGDVLRRRWLLVDVDPAKPAHAKDDSSSDDEHRAAQRLSADVRAWLMGEYEWPEPVIVDSGNGWHLLYRVDLPNDDDSQQLLRGVLYTLAEKFDGDRGKIDRSVHNASRIAKLPGTWARKGPDAADRPHRLSRLVYAPQDAKVVTAAKLERVRGKADAKPVLPFKPTNGTVEESAAPFVLKPPGDNDAAYVAAAVKKECDYVRSGRHKNHDGRNNSLNAAAFALGQLVAGGVLDRAEAEGELTAVAVEVGLEQDANCGSRGIAATIRSGIEAGMKKPRGVPAEPAATLPPAGTPAAWSVVFRGEVVREGTAGEMRALGAASAGTAAGPQTFELTTLRELMAMDIPDPDWAIPGILAEGLNMLAGSPKSGKSMLALNLALTVAGGGKALGNIQTAAGDVLYLSLEDKLRRVKGRAHKMARLIGGDCIDRLTITTRWPRIQEGGLELLREWVRRVECPRLLIVDVLGKFRRPSREKGNQYEQDSEGMYCIKQFIDDYKMTGQVLHHTRKQKEKPGPDYDEMEDISGTQGLLGACDGAIVLKRLRRSNDAIVSITGRDDAEKQLALSFDPATLTWTSHGTAEEHLAGKLQQEVLGYLKGRANQPVFARDVADHLQEPTTDKVRPTLFKLLEKGLIRRHGNGWMYPGSDEESF